MCTYVCVCVWKCNAGRLAQSDLGMYTTNAMLGGCCPTHDVKHVRVHVRAKDSARAQQGKVEVCVCAQCLCVSVCVLCVCACVCEYVCASLILVMSLCV